MNWTTISRNVGYALLVSALFMFLSVLVSFANGNDSACAALIISFTLTFVSGIFPFIFVRRTSRITLKEGYVIITLSWLLSFVFGMLPYALWGGPFSIQNAWFESVSGFTTTGATILDNVEALPKSLLFWRSSTHFIGGLGVVVFLLLIIPDSSPVKMRLTNMELSSLSKDAYSSRLNNTANIFAYVYLAIGLVAFLSYWLAGMTAFDAVCHAMSVCATGGFSTRNLSIAAFDSRVIEGLTMVFMYLSSIHFGLLFLTVVGRSFKPLKNPIIRFYSMSILVVAVILSISMVARGFCHNYGEAIWKSLFQTLCISSTTGFGIIDNSQWPLSMSFPLMLIAVMCGCAGSTSGGVKADRILLLFKSLGRQLKNLLHPTSVNEIKFSGRILRESEVMPHFIYLAMYFILASLSVMLCTWVGMDNINAFASTVTSLSNVGPGLGQFGFMGSFNSAPGLAKAIYTIDMFLGRVEIYPVLAVVAMLFDKRNK